eukprot:TRINITY_DN2236_c1_g1_i1.p1 TRINITY_DN2236_c1_g1~~TRINITY_DN2236_c1_g1_i1.p1  ORF type:complete len:572 (+),score=200.76 TRINITY_DN2236_c1_g1_i1:61-1776(+)
MPETASLKRPADGESPRGQAKRRRANPPAFSGTQADRAAIVAPHRLKLVKALREGGWAAAQAVLDDVAALSVTDGTEEQRMPWALFVLYAELTELVADKDMPALFDYMEQERVLALVWGVPKGSRTALMSLIQPLLQAAKSMSHRVHAGPALHGRARLLINRALMIRQEVHVYPKNAFCRCGGGLDYASGFTLPDTCAPAVHKALNTHHKVGLPDGGQVAEDVRALSALLKRVSEKLDQDACIELANEGDAVLKRLLDALKAAEKAAKPFGAVEGPRAEAFQTPRLPGGLWDAVSAQDAQYRLTLLLMMDAFLGFLLNRFCEELGEDWNPREGRMKDQEAEAGVATVVALLTAVEKALGSKALKEGVGSERLREVAWVSWKKQGLPLGCRGTALNGVDAAVADAAVRAKYANILKTGSKGTAEERRKYAADGHAQFPAKEVEDTNSVALPTAAKFAVDVHKFFEKKPAYVTGISNAAQAWRYHKVQTAGMSADFLTPSTVPRGEPLPSYMPPTQLNLADHKLDTKAGAAVGLWRCGRLLAATDVEFALQDVSYSYCDREAFKEYAKAHTGK